ncbi:LPS export ABC transporter periplasmic protein LptC [Seongchinamella sediminis]|uniref:LPS export ABC transporter periplasmic protein LptC n=1 Tax=Seongchinamella sediminis TaxID=2283635 RepID=A0A3L7E195_9GAMM|nr:LPS export ABC transporter periplasmic protein LptC [Seongchinamella sediminis]RLQ21912.1 LPS export ABC transporter periplasmic protein LptC [Seongchinamella sediminis]
MPRLPLQILLAITLLVAAGYFWRPQTAGTPDVQTTQRQRELPQTYLQTVRAWSFDEDGMLTDIVEAEQLEHFPRRKLTLIGEPRFYAHSGDDKTWSASAERGRDDGRRERLLLRRNVVLIHDQTGTRLDTQALNIDLDRQIASSDRRVTVVQGNSRTVADGIEVRMQEETILMKPNVESIYAQAP